MKKIMKYYFSFILLLWTLSFSSLSAQQAEYVNNDGLFFEIRTDTANLARYTEDNEIYKAGNIYHFTYTYKDKLNNEFYYSRLPDEIWEFIPKEKMKDSAIIGFSIKILPDLDNFKRLPEYNQTVIKYTYVMSNGKVDNSFSEKTGLVENSMNIWMHPPRTDFFKILEINPFPFIQQPYKNGNKWRWSLEIGGFWGDARWKTWEEVITNQYVYEIIDVDNIIRTSLGELNCYKIDSYAESELGKTHLISYFNGTYGFVRLEYINIDGSTLNIELYKADIK
jgi:hypothetical protein